METNRFCARVWQCYGLWNRDLDKGMEDDILTVLAERTATPPARVLATTFRDYAGYHEAQLVDSASEPTPWLRCFGLRFPRRDVPWLQYCPYCLRQDPTPYFRRCWRLAFVTACPEHHVGLHDRCPSCTALVQLHRLPLESKAITQCSSCSFDLRSDSSSPLRLGSPPLQDDLIRFQTMLLDTMQNGWFRRPGHPTVEAISFFVTLQVLGRLMIVTKRDLDRQGHFGLHLRQRPFKLRFPSGPERAMEVLAVSERAKLLLLISWWIPHHQEWFERMLQRQLFFKPMDKQGGLKRVSRIRQR